MEDTHRDIQENIQSQKFIVLILVLMEDTHRAQKCLQQGHLLVLILVLMEDTHRVSLLVCST